MTSRILKNLLNLFILLSLLVIIYILISGGQTLYISSVKIRLNHLHNPLLIFSILLALRLSLFRDSDSVVDRAVLKLSENYCEFIGKDTNKELLIYLLIISVITLFPYVRIFNNFFLWDDFNLLEESVKSSGNILNLFSLKLGHFFRPLYNLVFLFNYKLFGLDPSGYYIINYLLHIVNSLLLFYFAYLLTNNRSISFLASLLFAVNFEHYQAIMKVSEIASLQAAMLYLTALILFSKYLISKSKASYFASAITFGLSLLTYEGTVTLLPIMFLYDVIFHERLNISNISQFIRRYAVFIILLIPYLLFQYYIQSDSPLIARNDIAINFHVPYKIFRSTITINEWIIPVLILSVIIIRNYITRQLLKDLFNNPVVIFSFIWIPITLIPFSFFQNTTIVASRYFYTPSIGSSILLSFLIYSFYQAGTKLIQTTDKQSWGRFKASLIMITVVIILSNSFQIYHREQFFGKKPDWRKIIHTLKTQYDNFPDNSKIYFLNISTGEVHVKALMHVFFNPTLKTFSSKTGKINIQKKSRENEEKIFVFDYVNGEIIDRTSDYIHSGLKRTPYS